MTKSRDGSHRGGYEIAPAGTDDNDIIRYCV